MKKALLLSLLFLGVFFIGQNAKASYGDILNWSGSGSWGDSYILTSSTVPFWWVAQRSATGTASIWIEDKGTCTDYVNWGFQGSANGETVDLTWGSGWVPHTWVNNELNTFDVGVVFTQGWKYKFWFEPCTATSSITAIAGPFSGSSTPYAVISSDLAAPEITYSNYASYFEDLKITPQYPLDCQFNIVATTSSSTLDFTATGNINNPYDSNIIITGSFIKFTKSTGEVSTSSIGGTLNPNESTIYIKNLSLANSTYKVSYYLEGYDQDSGDPINYDFFCSGTGLGATKPTGNIDWWGSVGYLACQDFYNNCVASSTDFLEESICKIQGLGISLVCPSPETLSKAKGIINDIGGRFPINYINVAKTSLTSFASTATATTSATTSWIMADFSYFNQLKEIAFFGYVRILTGFLLLGGTGFFIINYAVKHALK